MNTVDLRQVTEFLSTYQIAQINPQTLLLTSKKTNFLVKYHKVEGDVDEVIDILDKHLSFDSEYVCPLLHFERCENEEGQDSIRAVYQLDRLTLKESIEVKRRSQENFSEPQIWILLSSLVNSLLYLQGKDVVYGVLSPNKIFIEEKIRIMDPSAYNINPMNVSRLSLHSPQIRLNKVDIDFYISDVYLLGLCILSAATLIDIDKTIRKEDMEGLLDIIQQSYSSDLLHVLKYMLKFEAEERPTLHNILQYIETQIQIKEAKVTLAQVLPADEQDNVLENYIMEQVDCQNIDILQIDLKIQDQINQYQQARQRYIYSSSEKEHNMPTNCQSSLESIEHMDSIEFIGHKETINLKKSNYYIQQFKLGQCGTHHSNETILKNKKRAQQIKNRNSQAVKTIHSVVIPNHEQRQPYDEIRPFTSPELMSILKQQTKRALQFFIDTSKIKQ